MGKTAVSFQFIYVALLVIVLMLDNSGGIFCCFLASFFHEIGHLSALLLLKQKVDEIKFSVFDIKIKSTCFVGFSRELIIVLSGVTMNFLLCIFLYRIIPLFSLANLFIGIFNILPVSTLDGGQALKLILCNFLSQKKANLIINILTVIVSIPIFTLGIIILFNTGYNFSFLLLGIYLILTVVYNRKIIR
ncbi:MAG: hypothetical protein J1F17_03765 [Oscillospiraceae bacterium]|nr:hypothetical protein [Oscillospiraceae bacterium]